MTEHILQRESPLFDKFIPMQIIFSTPSAESSPNPLCQDSKIANLVLRIINGTRSIGTIGAQVERLVHFEVTDEQDPYFYYYMDVGEQDFHQFKRDQHILVEFSVFPVKIIELIQLCLSQPATETSNMLSAGNSTFIAKLDISALNTSGSGVFSIVEVNMFKQLTHISLLLKPGDDAAVKMYLASRLHLSMELSQRRSEDISSLKEELSNSKQINEEMESELVQLRTMKNVEMQSLAAEHAKELSQLQRQAMESCEQLRVRYEAQAEAARSTNDSFQRDLIAKTAAFDRQLSDVLQEKNELEFKLRDASRSSQAVELDRDRLLKECDDLVARVRQLTDEKSMLQKDAIRLESKAEGLLQQLKDRDESMSKSAQLQRTSDEAKTTAEQRLQAELRAGDALREELRQAASEMDRMEQMIVKLQSSSSSQKEKIKVKSEVIRRQEAVVTELRAKLNDMEMQLSATKDSLSLSAAQADSLRKQLAESEARAKEREQVLANQQDVITYLNDEITRSQVGIRKSPSAAAAAAVATIPSQQQPLHHLYTPQRAPTSAFKSPISAISMNGIGSSDAPHRHHEGEKDVTHMKNLMHTHSSGVTYSDIHSNLTEDSLRGFGFKDSAGDNIYLRGLRNLGLTSAMKNEGLDAALLQDFTQQMSFQASSPHSSSFTEDLQHRTVDLESLDYYAVDMFPPSTAARQPDLTTTAAAATTTNSGSSRNIKKKEAVDRDLLVIKPGRSTRKSYPWEEEDFGLEAAAQVS